MADLLIDLPEQAQKTLSKKGFAEHIGLTPGRISQLIERGLPVTPQGRIDVADGEAWYSANVDQNRARAGKLADDDEVETERGLRAEQVRHMQLKNAAMAGDLLDRDTTLRTVESIARLNRDAWMGWSARTAAELAKATGAPMETVAPLLDRLVRDQLDQLSKMPAVVPSR